MLFDLSKVEMSKVDVKKMINLPRFLNDELAECIGIIIGDGHLGCYPGISTSGHRIIRSEVDITCNASEQQYIEYITRLFYNIFRVNLRYVPDPRSKTVILRINSKAIVQFLNRICEIPLNKKTDIVFIPKIIKNAHDKLICSFLRGLADTDFTVTFKNRTGIGHNYPVIKAAFKSQKLIEDLEIIYKRLGFLYCVVYNEKGYDKRKNSYDIRHCIYLNGKKNFKDGCILLDFQT